MRPAFRPPPLPQSQSPLLQKLKISLRGQPCGSVPPISLTLKDLKSNLWQREKNRRQYLMGLGRSQDENDTLRRFFQGLEQGIECALGEHVDFVDDVYLILPNRSEGILPSRGCLGFHRRRCCWQRQFPQHPGCCPRQFPGKKGILRRARLFPERHN